MEKYLKFPELLDRVKDKDPMTRLHLGDLMAAVLTKYDVFLSKEQRL